ncbi:adhesion G-protein coupled receptor G6-like [Dendronephthya gigantea]|uniref:adhesion G-protein coupled receptor G6-like n=1 Tax=Dendronephthya gigantea TaxID=151771 RepID=UPI001069947D|nr:adhesion G-protein coupled receptor G6-like [Dendronephthya gigantea]
MESSHTLGKDVTTAPVIDISITTISAVLHVTPSSAFSITSSPSVKTTISTQGSCSRDVDGSPEAYGIFLWPETPTGNISTVACPYNNESFASRECFYTNKKGGESVWGPTVATKCIFKNERSKDIFRLSEEEVNVNNVVKIVEELKNLSIVDQNSTLNAGDIDNIATVLENIAAVKGKANEIFDDFTDTIDNVLDSKIENILKAQVERKSSSRIVNILDNFADSLVAGPEGKLEADKRNFAINLQTVLTQSFSGLNFSGVNNVSGEPKRENNGIPPSLMIPQTIFNDSTVNTSAANHTVIFVLYKDSKFFRVSLEDTTRTFGRLNSLVISGRIKGLSVQNLNNAVHFALSSIEEGDTNSTLCSYWNFTIGTGNWSQEGCQFEGVLNDGRVLCSCNHLTNFAMLMDVYPGEKTVHDRILGVVSYVGCALSLVGLTFTIITILILRELRTQLPSQILLNFCIALSLTIVVFLAAAEESKTSSLAGCRTAAIALHYFLLAAFLWMAVEAYNMYRAFVIVFADSHPSKFLMKCCLFAWGKNCQNMDHYFNAS